MAKVSLGPACPHPATMGGLCVACGSVVSARVVAAAGDARAQDDT